MKNKKVFLFVFVILLIIFIYAFCLFFDNTFTVEKWNSNIWEREDMIEDLTNKYNFYNMTDKDIINLLGKNGLVEESYYTYYVGKDYCGPILFNISFFDNGYVKDYGIIID